MAEVQVFGIRHHGPGSSRMLLEALDKLQPDILLIEGPPDADSVMPLLAHRDMTPPVALLVYSEHEPKNASYYPFARFSPEYQAIRYALTHDITVRFMDLPQSMRFWLRTQAELKAVEEAENGDAEQEPQDLVEQAKVFVEGGNPDEEEPDEATRLRRDPLGELGKAAGYSDGERWWEHMVEQRQDSTDLFDAVLEAMTALREITDIPIEPTEPLREAFMRQSIRAALEQGFERLAVVCGAWHAPVLLPEVMPPAEEDASTLAEVGHERVAATWIPWTHGRLTMYSGYGAGIRSPGWYQHLWDSRGTDTGVTWLSKVAKLLRDEDLSASPAQVIDAVRLSETLAILRERPVPGLTEFNEAALTVFCFGDTRPLQLIHDKLIVGETMGEVPSDTPTVPLQRDWDRECKRLKLRPQVEMSTLSLDLRNENHLERSHFLNRLRLLDVPWGTKQDVTHKRGTYSEVWQLLWTPELFIRLIERSPYGNIIYDAATAYAKSIATEADALPQLTQLVNAVLLSDLPEAVGEVVKRLRDRAALTGDVTVLMQSLPALADVLTYGNVRKTDASMVEAVVDGIVTRVFVGLPGACSSLADEAAEEMFALVQMFHSAIRLLNDLNHTDGWYKALNRLVHQNGVHGVVAGRACRILLDMREISKNEAVQNMRLALSGASTPEQSAAWIDGFLRGRGLILLHDDVLLQAIDGWVVALSGDNFDKLLPLLRRTFSTFTQPELRKIGEIVSGRDKKRQQREDEIDLERAEATLPIFAELLGLDRENGDDGNE